MGRMLVRWAECQQKHATVTDFLEWAEAKGYVEINTPPKVSTMVDEYFDIDQAQLDKERRKLLEGANAT